MATSFKSLDIPVPQTGFVGDKIKINRIFNKQVLIHKYRIVPSTMEKGSGKRLDLQIEMGNEKYLTWCGSVVLMEMLEKVPKDAFPLETTIIDDNGRYILT